MKTPRGAAPRFFCENCGAEVPRGAPRCPDCGRYFASVRCPSCSFIGEEALFSEGCPVCGYSAPHEGGHGRWEREFDRETTPRRAAGRLPAWVYAATLVALAVVFAAALYLLR